MKDTQGSPARLPPEVSGPSKGVRPPRAERERCAWERGLPLAVPREPCPPPLPELRSAPSAGVSASRGRRKDRRARERGVPTCAHRWMCVRHVSASAHLSGITWCPCFHAQEGRLGPSRPGLLTGVIWAGWSWVGRGGGRGRRRRTSPCSSSGEGVPGPPHPRWWGSGPVRPHSAAWVPQRGHKEGRSEEP